MNCSYTNEVAAYLDGELESSAVVVFEEHLQGCGICLEKLNEQKRLISSLEFMFDEKDFELPKDFARKIAVRAEADVSGLQTKVERWRALWITLSLFAVGVTIGIIGKKSGVLPNVFDRFLTQIWVVGEVLGRFLIDSPIVGLMFAVLLILSFVAVSGLLLKSRRV